MIVASGSRWSTHSCIFQTRRSTSHDNYLIRFPHIRLHLAQLGASGLGAITRIRIQGRAVADGSDFGGGIGEVVMGSNDRPCLRDLLDGLRDAVEHRGNLARTRSGFSRAIPLTVLAPCIRRWNVDHYLPRHETSLSD